MLKPQILFKNMFECEEDNIIQQECDCCGYSTDDPVKIDDIIEKGEICPECGGDMINTTSHEGDICDYCGGYIDMWEDIYVCEGVRICKFCYDKLENKSDKIVATSEWIFGI